MAEAEAVASGVSASESGSTMAMPEAGSGQPCLTPREREVPRLVMEGLSDKEIGAVLTISAQTATKHVGNLLRKLEVLSRTAAATLAVRRGLM